MTCWYCHWGWAEPVARIYVKALVDLGGNEFPLVCGPSHIVWADENFWDHNLQWCLKECNEAPGDYDLSQTEMDIVRRSLEEMLALPESDRCVQPSEYEDADDDDPSHFPPAPGVRVVDVQDFLFTCGTKFAQNDGVELFDEWIKATSTS